MDESTLGSRLKKLRESQGLKQKEFGKKLQTSASVISVAERNDSIPNGVSFIRIAECWPTLNLRWLLTGDGLMWEGEGGAALGKAQGIPGVDVERLTVLARRAGNLALWRVWRILADRGPMGLDELEEAFPDEDREELAADILLAEEYGFLQKVEGQQGIAYQAGTGVLRSRDIAELSQLGLEALKELREIVGIISAHPEMARLATASLNVPAGMAPEVMRRLWGRWRDAFLEEGHENRGEDRLSLVLGMAVTASNVDAKMK